MLNKDICIKCIRESVGRDGWGSHHEYIWEEHKKICCSILDSYHYSIYSIPLGCIKYVEQLILSDRNINNVK